MLWAALATGALITASTPSSGDAETAPALRAESAALSRSESTAVLELYAAESSLARAQSELSQLDERSDRLAHTEQSVHRRTEIVRRSLNASQERVAVLLRELYIQGEPDPISVILGATSLDEAMAGIEGLSRATAQNERLVIEAERRAERLERLRAQLVVERTRLTGAQTAARAGATRLAQAVAGRSETLAGLRRRQTLTAQRLTALQAQARRAERRSAKITATSAAATRQQIEPETPAAARPAPTATTPPTVSPPTGTRTLVVDAVAYYLPGRTASGLPVGVGVIAVDPSVIPLGTRVFVPGYGPAVAADVGSAIKGDLIDLWMPSTAQANAWGRRTVTITVYG